jgi:hypothetical protein
VRQKNNFANSQTVRSIDFCLSSVIGTGNLSPRARRTLGVYVALVLMGYDGLDAPMGAIADAVYRSSRGEARSTRTLARANAELEASGYIVSLHVANPWRYKGAHIRFNLAAFAFWTQKQSQNVSPIKSVNVRTSEQMCGNLPLSTTCQPSDWTRTKTRVNSCNYNNNSNKQRAGARANNNNRRKNPVYWSVVCVLAKMGLYRADRKRARQRADIEIRCENAKIEQPANCSGIDWAYWMASKTRPDGTKTTRWEEMPISQREATAKREIIPYLLGADTVEPPHTASPPEVIEPIPADEIRQIIEQLESKMKGKSSNADPIVPPTSYPDIDDTDPEIQKLIEARDKARRRNVG